MQYNYSIVLEITVLKDDSWVVTNVTNRNANGLILRDTLRIFINMLTSG